MSHQPDYPSKQIDDQRMGSQRNSTSAMVPTVPYAIEKLGTNLVPQEVHPPQEPLFGNKHIFLPTP